MRLNSIHIIALAALGGGLSGGDRIFIEFARRWSKKVPVTVYVWEEGQKMCAREKLDTSDAEIKVVKVGNFSKLGFVFTYFYRILLGIKLGLTLKIEEGDRIYSASEFWMDCLPALIFKLRNPKVKWAAAWYQTAPNPFKGFAEGKREKTYRLPAFLYWFMQLPVKPLISKFADYMLINNEEERKQFLNNKTIIVPGAVRTDLILFYQKKHKIPKNKKYLAVFQGRFHPQKGAVELIDIWKLVTKKIPDAKLAMIGDGPLMSDVDNRIRELKLENNIELFGYLHDGDNKYFIFNNSKIVVHPAFFDSGGMAAAEAMAFGLPCVGFDLKSYMSYYPKGMLKVPAGNLEDFAKEIISLNYNEDLRKKTGEDAKKMVLTDYSWDERAEEILLQILEEKK